MRAVYKFPVPIESDHFAVDMPEAADLLTVQMQGSIPCVWARVETDASLRARHFRWAGTGHPLAEDVAWEYVGTVQLHDGELVFHLFAEP